MKKNQMMLTCSSLMLILQSVAYYMVWSSGYSQTMLRRMLLVALFMLFPVLGILLFLQFELALIELLVIILAIVVAVVDKRKNNA